MNSDEDKKLVVSLRKGSVEAFDELFARYSKRIYSFAFSYLKSREDSEGIVQEVFFPHLEEQAQGQRILFIQILPFYHQL